MTTSAPPTPGVAGTQVEYGPDSGGRLKGVTVVKPVVVGNVAKYFGKKREEDGHTHQWTVYVRPYVNEDYSVFIKKVHFKLHDSYANANRVVTKPPYEVQETGWGEFEVTIKIYFNDPVERPVTLYHILKLFQSSGPGQPGEPLQVKKVLTSEYYDEIVFQEPTMLMKSLLDSVTPVTQGVWAHEHDYELKKRATTADLEEARKKVKDEISDLKDKLNLAKDTIEQFKAALANVNKEGQVGGGGGSGSSSPRKSDASKVQIAHQVKLEIDSSPVPSTSTGGDTSMFG